MEELKNQINEQMHKAFFDKLTTDFNSNPPKTDHIKILISELYDKLCKFIPSKKKIHDKIKQDLLIHTIGLDTMPIIVLSLIKWIESFQAPYHDKKTNIWKKQLHTCDNCTNYLIQFLKEYYQHLEITFKELCDARYRLINGDSLIPPEHRPSINNISDIRMKSGR
tara:strand:- start:578 stop:1075 length:498 start_codon:yes stop_codon:yes gene_type:complete